MFELPFDPPVQKISNELFRYKNIGVFMKRDDLIHPFVSGNKWRKLKYVFEHAKQYKKNHFVSFGGAYSNHLVALACAGAMHGFKTSAFVRGEKVKNHMLYLCKTWGMDLHFVSRESYRNKQHLFDKKFGADDKVMFIDEGGRGELAMKGCTEILDKIETDFTHVFCAVGTGTTLAGLALAAAKKNSRAEGICVLKGADGIDNDVKKLIPGLANWKIHHNYYRGGYAKTDEELMTFIQHFATTTGILLDQVYTAKMVMAVFDLILRDYFRPGSDILLVHTGGLLGLMSQE